MKVLYIVDQMKFGGIETMLLSTVQAMKRAGHTPVALIMSSTGALFNELEISGIEVHSITDRVQDLGFFKPRLIMAIRDIIKRIKPDIVHPYDIISGHMVRIASVGLSVPVVYHLHNIIPHGRIKYRIASKILSFATDKYIAVSQQVADCRLPLENSAKKPCATLYNALETAPFDEAKRLNFQSLSQCDGPCVITCSRLVPQKNINVLIEAMHHVVASLPKAHALIIGDGPERERLQKLAQDLNLSNNVTFTGFRKDIPEIFKSAGNHHTVLAMPSAYEGFPRAIVEAFYCGIPAVISENVPAKEISGDGALVVPVDVKALADALYTVLSDKETHHKMQQAALEVSKSLVMPVHIKQLIDIYKSVL